MEGVAGGAPNPGDRGAGCRWRLWSLGAWLRGWLLGGEAERWAGSGGWMVTVVVGAARDPVLLTLPFETLGSAGRSGHASSRIRVWASAPWDVPTAWPECGWLGLGTVPTATASWACPA